MPQYLPSDPLFPVQWHLLNTGNTFGSIAGFDINVVRVWPDYTGQGVLVTALEAGMDETHPDLIRNYRQDLAWNLPERQQGSAAATPGDPNHNHGTPVLGLIGATEGNGMGGTGVAWNADLTMHLMDFRVRATPQDISQVQFSAGQIIASQSDIWSNSWGLSDQPFDQTVNTVPMYDMLRALATEGRGGLGTIAVYSAGNEQQRGFDTNYIPTAKQPYAITVGSMAQNGVPAVYSTPGSTVLISAPGSEPRSIVTTDRQGEDGYNPLPGEAGNYTDRDGSFFSGTSAAAPIVSGVVALILEANPGLGYRDVQEILAYSAKRAHFLPQQTDSTVNGAPDWNGAGLIHGHVYGFGAIDALAAVRLAESWHKTSTVQNLLIRESSATDGLNVTVQPGETRTTTLQFDTAARAEYITIKLDLNAPELQHVSAFLVSPSGTESPLLLRPPAIDNNGDPAPLTTHLVDTLGSVRHWGENIAGSWTLRLDNSQDGQPVALNTWSLQAYTPDAPNPGTQIFTDEFATMAMLQPARTLLNPYQGQSINAAAVTKDTFIDLSNGQALIAGVSTALADPGDFLNLYAGDGNDLLRGNARDNILMPGRGNDRVDGGAGIDAVKFVRTFDQYALDTTAADLQVHGLAHGGEGTDTVRNVEILLFTDQVKLANAPDANNPYGVDERIYLERNPDVAAAVAEGSIASGQAHFETWGRHEGRAPTVLFDEARYLAQNPDVAQAVAAAQLNSGYQHYTTYGWSEGRSPSAWFNGEAYLASNADVGAAGIDPLGHYLAFGVHEGRVIQGSLDTIWF